jgi:hypothetical protein
MESTLLRIYLSIVAEGVETPQLPSCRSISSEHEGTFHGERVLKNLNLSVAQMDDLLSFLDTLEEELPPATLRQPLAR